jgi:UDP-glucose 4-epimerase
VAVAHDRATVAAGSELMRLVVTGASGFIGRNALLRAPRDWQITAVANRTPGLEEFVTAHRLSNVRVVRCDLTDAADVRAASSQAGRADAVLYLAANGDPAASAERPRWDLESNTLALVTFLDAWPVDHVVYLSSGAVYDGLPYAISKLASEQYVRFFCERRHAVGGYVNVRFFGAYGPYEPARKITTRWLLALASGQRDFVLRGNGENLIDFMYVDDAIDGMLRLVETAGTRATIDVASGNPVSINAIVAAMARVLSVEVTVRHEGETEEYIQFRSSDTTMRDRCGEGHMFAGTDTRPVQVDVSMTRLRRAAVARWVLCADAYALPFRAESFRMVLLAAVLEHTREPWRILAEARRVLKPGGTVVIVVPNDVTMSAGRLVLRKFPIRYPDHLTFMTPGRIRGWLSDGFRTREAFHLPIRQLPFAVNLYHFVVAERI